MTITVEHTISMGHRLPSYRGICSSPHGHNVRVEVTLDVAVFLDFKLVSDKLKEVLEPMDHAMVLHVEDPLLKTLRDMMFRVVACKEEPTTEAIARHILSEMVIRVEHLMCTVLTVTVHETDRYSATAYTGEGA